MSKAFRLSPLVPFRDNCHFVRRSVDCVLSAIKIVSEDCDTAADEPRQILTAWSVDRIIRFPTTRFSSVVSSFIRGVSVPGEALGISETRVTSAAWSSFVEINKSDYCLQVSIKFFNINAFHIISIKSQIIGACGTERLLKGHSPYSSDGNSDRIDQLVKTDLSVL